MEAVRYVGYIRSEYTQSFSGNSMTTVQTQTFSAKFDA